MICTCGKELDSRDIKDDNYVCWWCGDKTASSFNVENDAVFGSAIKDLTRQILQQINDMSAMPIFFKPTKDGHSEHPARFPTASNTFKWIK